MAIKTEQKKASKSKSSWEREKDDHEQKQQLNTGESSGALGARVTCERQTSCNRYGLLQSEQGPKLDAAETSTAPKNAQQLKGYPTIKLLNRDRMTRVKFESVADSSHIFWLEQSWVKSLNWIWIRMGKNMFDLEVKSSICTL